MPTIEPGDEMRALARDLKHGIVPFEAAVEASPPAEAARRLGRVLHELSRHRGDTIETLRYALVEMPRRYPYPASEVAAWFAGEVRIPEEAFGPLCQRLALRPMHFDALAALQARAPAFRREDYTAALAVLAQELGEPNASALSKRLYLASGSTAQTVLLSPGNLTVETLDKLLETARRLGASDESTAELGTIFAALPPEERFAYHGELSRTFRSRIMRSGLAAHRVSDALMAVGYPLPLTRTKAWEIGRGHYAPHHPETFWAAADALLSTRPGVETDPPLSYLHDFERHLKADRLWQAAETSGDRLRAARERAGLSQAALARVTAISSTVINAAEAGAESGMPSIAMWRHLGDALEAIEADRLARLGDAATPWLTPAKRREIDASWYVERDRRAKTPYVTRHGERHRETIGGDWRKRVVEMRQILGAAQSSERA